MNPSTLVLSLAAILTSGSIATAGGGSPPVCDNGGPYVAECTGPITIVPLDGSASFDPDGTPVTYFWFDECPFGSFDDPTNPQANFIVDNTGVCQRVCVIVLRVTSGGETTPCQTTVTVNDTTAPVITCPADVVEVWTVGPAGGQTDPQNTGSASAVDCDPNPVIGFSDVLDPGTQPGEPETIVTRTWTATDFCLNQSNCVQTITLLSPSQPLFSKLDVMPGACPNTSNAKASSGVLQVVLYGTTGFDPSLVDRTTLKLQRKDNVGGTLAVVNMRLRDAGTPPAGSGPCECGSTKGDGRVDLQISVDAAQFSSGLGLVTESLGGQTIDIALTGRLQDGRWFVVSDCLTME